MRLATPTGGEVLRYVVISQRRRVVTSSLVGAVYQAGEALIPVVIGTIIDRAIATGSLPELVQWILVLAVVFVGLSLSLRFAAWTANRAAEQAAHDLRVRLTGRILDPRGGAEVGRLTGALTSIATEDAKQVGAVNLALPMGIAGLAALAVSASALLWISVPLGLLVLLGVPPLLGLTHLLGKPLERRTALEQERAAHSSSIAADLVNGLRVVKGIGAEGAATERYRRTSRDSLAAALRTARAYAWHDGTIRALTGIFIAVVALVGGWLATQGEISIGGLIAAVGLAQFLITPLDMIRFVNSELARARASAARVASVLAAPPALRTGTNRIAEPLRGHVRLRGVSHGALREVDLEVAPGELIGLVVPAPAAANALLDCLSREVDPESGSVELDGVMLSTLDAGDVRAAILLATHDAELFEGSLLENVHTGTATRNVVQALSAAAADEVAQTLPHGVNTAVSERGRSLSGGQRQRVALARALACDPPILLVHDPTTAVDTVTEARIATGIKQLRRGRTTIMVTTSPALLAVTDRVVVLSEGTVTAQGRHGDLIHENDAYRAAVLA